MSGCCFRTTYFKKLAICGLPQLTIKYVELDGSDHSPMYYEHQKLIYEGIIDFPGNECGTMSTKMQAGTSD